MTKRTRRLEMLNQQRKIFHMTGIIPLAYIYDNHWKVTAYSIFTMSLLLWFSSVSVLMSILLYQKLGDIEMATAIMFQLSCVINVGAIYFYFVLHRDKIRKLFDDLECRFIKHMDKVGSQERYENILKEASEKCSLITRIMLGSGISVMTTWAIVPLAMGYIEYLTDTAPEDLTNQRVRYFGAAMWVPENVNQSPMYEIWQAYHFGMCYTVVFNIVGCYMLMYALPFHITTLFKLLCAAFEDIENVVKKQQLSKNVENSYKSRNYNVNSNGATNGYSDDLDCLLTIAEDNNIPGHVTNENYYTDKDTTDSKLRYYRKFVAAKQNSWGISSSNQIHHTSVNVHVSTNNEVIHYLIDCVQFHQELIEFSTEVNDLLSPVILIFFLFSEAMMCLSCFQLTMGRDDRGIQYLTSALLACVWPYLVCTAGEGLIQQSLDVERVATSCSWYNHYTSFNKVLQMVIMRSQKPVVLQAGKFFIVSLETFGEIANKVYALFTILKRMKE